MRSDSMTYAPLKKRIYAFLLDYLVIVTYGIFVVGALSFLFRSFFLPLFSNSPVTAEWTGFLIITLPSHSTSYCANVLDGRAHGERKKCLSMLLTVWGNVSGSFA